MGLLVLLITLPQWYQSEADPAVSLDCVEGYPRCHTQLEKESLHLAVEPETLPAMHTLQVSLQGAEHIGWQSAAFTGVDMDMGWHPLRIIKGAQPGEYQLEGMIPICSVNSRMRWQLEMTAQINGKSQRVLWILGPSSRPHRDKDKMENRIR